jgi:hypothetical protein
MKDRLRKFLEACVQQTDRDIADALRLPWAGCSEFLGCVLGFMGLVIGVVVSIPGALGGCLVGYLIGKLLGGLIAAFFIGIVWILPTPFGWLSRRLGYA